MANLRKGLPGWAKCGHEDLEVGRYREEGEGVQISGGKQSGKVHRQHDLNFEASISVNV